MEEGKAGGLNSIVTDIAHVGATDTDPHLRNIEDVSAATTFATHSAFPTFLRIGLTGPDPAAAMYVQTPAMVQALFNHLVDYKTLRFEVSRADIVHDLHEFLVLEGRDPATSTSL